MTFLRSSRFRSRVISALLTALGLTILTALLFGRQYDATTQFGPTDHAMRRVINAGMDEVGQQPVLTNEARSEEARRIAFGASNSNTVNGAVILLAGAGQLRQELAPDLPDSPGGPDYDAVAESVRKKINELEPGINVQTWERPKNDPEGPIDRIVKQTGIPVALWADFIYLDQKMSFYGVSRDFLQGERLAETRARLAKKVEATIPDPRDIVLTVRHRDPYVAEILANAVTALYKYHYDTANLQSSLKQVRFYQKRREVAARQFGLVCRSLQAYRQQHHNALRSDGVDEMKYQYSFNGAAEAMSEASLKLRHAEEDFARLDETGSLNVAYWAGMPPGTMNHPESPVSDGGTKGKTAFLTNVFFLGFLGSFGAFSALGAFIHSASTARNQPAETAQEELPEAEQEPTVEDESNF